MEDIRVLIADDDSGMRLILRRLIEKTGGYKIVGEVSDGGALIEAYEHEEPEVVITDVEMPVMTGIECAKLIQDKNPRTVLIFVTAHEEYMKSAFEVYAFDYLVKPFKVERALKTLERLKTTLRSPEEPVKLNKKPASRLMLKTKEGMEFIDFAEIILIQREDRSTVIYCDDGSRHVTSDSLGEIEEKLPDWFFRTHKSYIVNVNKVDSVSPYGRWTYILKLEGTKLDALITSERLEALQKMFE